MNASQFQTIVWNLSIWLSLKQFYSSPLQSVWTLSPLICENKAPSSWLGDPEKPIVLIVLCDVWSDCEECGDLWSSDNIQLDKVN